MALGRRVLFTVASGSLIYSGMVSALGMGNITLNSALNQPLSAEIELLDAGDLSADEIRVVLASSTDFARVGVERLAFLQDLRFTPVIDGNRSRIRVASNKPVREPYLNFLVEITQAKSRMLREYTVLLDPMPGPSEVPSSFVGQDPQAVASPAPVEPVRFVPPAELPQASQGKRHRVTSGESLWSIAGAYAGGSRTSQAQVMRDIQALNPDAFAGGDAALLKAGANLLLPDAATRAAPAPIEPASAAPVAETTMLSELTPDASPAEPVPADPARVDDQVATLRRQLFEELAASREENQQLKQMLIDMRAQLETVTAQLVEQGRAQPTGSPAVEQSTPTITPQEPAVAQPMESTPAEPVSSFRWQDWALPGSGVLISMLLGGLWFGRRKKPESTYPDATPLAAAQPKHVPPVAVAPEMPRQPAHASVSETDALEAAAIYITYGRRDEAIDVLSRGIERAPAQLDIRLRHLELVAEAGDIASYCAAADGYLHAGGEQAQLDRLLALHPALASAVAAAAPVASETFLDPDITFVLDEALAADFLEAASEPAQQASAVESGQAHPAQPLIDGFDEVLTLGELTSLLGNAEPVESKPTAEELRQLEPNPEHLVRLNQAVAYIKQGNMESACAILETLATEGDEAQRQQVNELLAQIV
ncbi:FimV/HubP family polar landmark protein [Stutzerimonas stutzeri]|uniref:FimV/HubP family polar landmark protein n=1 Tax=Stutzerimonas stutzeri TaxID=316 RepID=UPI000309F990|nr:FimV/HubP family polar landmark protein [Stutzerimonas stutzeri]